VGPRVLLSSHPEITAVQNIPNARSLPRCSKALGQVNHVSQNEAGSAAVSIHEWLLSKSCKLQCEPFSPRYEWRYLTGAVDPLPEITIGEEVVAEHGDEVRE
jgi:hypothetical protein